MAKFSLADLKKLKEQNANKKVSLDKKAYSYIFYGVPSSGKTELTSAMFEGEHIMISAELGGKTAMYANSIPVGDYRTLKQLCKDLADEQVKKEIGDVIIVDTVTKVAEYIENYILDKHGKEFLSDVKSYNGAYKLIDKYFNQCFDPLKQMGYTFVWITHATSTTLTDEKGRDYDKWDLNGHKRCLEIIKKEVDNCFFLNRLPQEDGTTKRVLVSDATKFNFGKNKLNSARGEMDLYIELDKDPLVSAERVIDSMRRALEGRGKENITEEKGKVTIYEYKEEARPIEELRAEVSKWGKKLSEIGLREEAIDLMNHHLGEDYNGNQRGLNDIDQRGFETLEILITEMEELFNKNN